MVNKTVGAILAVVLAPLTLTCAPVLAQRYPDRPITFVVPYAPGGANELLARTISQKMSESIGQQVIVESRAGADGTIGSNFVARAVPDGYTILMGTNSTHGLAKFTTKSLAYDPVKDFTALTEATEMPVVLAVHPSVPVSNMKEFIAYVKKNPGKMSFGSPGAGGLHHFAGELLNKMTGIDMVHVPYKGTGPSMQDLVGGQIPAAFTSLAAAAPQMRAGKIRVLGLIGASRQPSSPEIPTISESVSGFTLPTAWNGVLGPAGLPAAIVKRLNTELVKALHSPDARAKIEAGGQNVIGNSAEDFAAMIKINIERWRAITAAIGFKPE